MQLLFNLNLCFYQSPCIYKFVITNYTVYIEPVLLNVLISSLEEKTEYTLKKFAKDSNLGDAVSTLEGRNIIWRTVYNLEDWANRNLIKFNHNKCKVLYLG